MNESPTNSAIEGDEARRMAESAETRASQVRLRRHRILVNVLRIGLVVVMLGGWELASVFGEAGRSRRTTWAMPT